MVGSNNVTAQTIETSYTRLIACLDKLITRKGFVLGSRPSSADFALYGQLTQLAIVEPTSAAITNEISPRIRAWIDLMDDLSGLPADDAGWVSRESASSDLHDLLCEIGRTYVPAMLANAAAIAAHRDSFETLIDGRAWSQPVFKYQAKCLDALKRAYALLTPSDRSAVAAILADTGCGALFE